MRTTQINEMNQWLETLSQGKQTGQLQSPGFLKPYHLVTLALMLKQQGAQWLDLPEAVETYAMRMGLWQAADIIPPYEMDIGPPKNHFLPVAALENPQDITTVAHNLTALLYPQAAKEKTMESMQIMLMELIENTYRHAEVDKQLHGLVCAQSWPRGNLAQIVFADIGIGMRQSLSANDTLLSALSTQNACQLACELGITSKPDAHSGYGLALTRALMKQSNGNMLVLSNQEGFYANARLDRPFDAPRWEGSVIILEWPMDQMLDVDKVYESWPLPEGFEA